MAKKSSEAQRKCKVFYQDLYGKRKIKQDFLWNNSIKTVDWKELKPEKEYSFFVIKDFSANGNYLKCFKINEIFKIYTSGIKTHNDKELVSFTKFKANDQIYDYKPFDNRNINYDIQKVIRHRVIVMKHFLSIKNYGLILMRKIIPSSIFNQVLITNNLIDGNYFGFQTYVFPLFVIKSEQKNNSTDNHFLYCDDQKIDNFTPKFRQFFKSKYKGKYTPKEILGYIYAVLHSPTYRTKYLEFLKIDFPRIPFTDNEEMFKQLSDIGLKLIDAHLMKEIPSAINCSLLGGGENFKVESVNYDKDKVWFNKERYFAHVPPDVWNFYIGGYQVLDKWLKERKKHGITLSSEDIQHFIKVVNILDYTIKTMQKIDILTIDWI